MTTLPVTTGNDKSFKSVIRECYCDTPVLNPGGQPRHGFYNLKRVYGNPASLRCLVLEVAKHLKSEAVCSPDMGMSPFVGALSFYAQIPSVFVRAVAKYYYLSYGQSLEHNNAYLVGECLRPGTTIDLVDDVLSDGSTMLAAISLLKRVELVPRGIICLLDMRKSDSIDVELKTLGIERVVFLTDAKSVRL